jgi:Fe-S cluster assembly scaffold protein SufB
MNGRVLSEAELRVRERDCTKWLEFHPDDVRTQKELDYIATIRDRDKTIAELTEQAADWVKKYTVAEAEHERLKWELADAVENCKAYEQLWLATKKQNALMLEALERVKNILADSHVSNCDATELWSEINDVVTPALAKVKGGETE